MDLGEHKVFINEKVFIYGGISGGSCIAVKLTFGFCVLMTELATSLK